MRLIPSKKILALALLLLSPHGTNAECPDLLALRSDFITSELFEANQLNNFYYEQLYHDIAQVGAKCQTLNVTSSDSDDGVINMAFSVKYGPVPFTINEIYTPTKAGPGLFNKNADMPGGKLLTLPTVVMDVAPDYSTMTLYSCLELPGSNAVRELVIATIDPEPSDETVQALIETAIDAGVDIKREDIKAVDYCP
ncbi:hypothetical protein TrVE_jg8932 [Triparma verrucosa]|uniref:Uncharacterized protein n=1 Tax=Triparma verrucosa TaxID=1606542 RepID=A0A9W6ZAT4_9STRA|nr:hypothetical protein TrVE_jg8932 [Triparma verrucosa]